MLNRTFLLCGILLATISLSACTPPPFPDTPTQPPTQQQNHQAQATSAERAGDFGTAGQEYLLHSQTLTSPEKEQYALRSAYAFSKAGYTRKALLTLAQVDRDQLSYVQQLDASILEADLLVSDNQAAQALRVLSPYDLSRAQPVQHKAALQVKVKAFEVTENWVEKANSHIALDRLLSGKDSQQQQNRNDLWQSLMMLDAETLSAFNPGHPPAIGSGWFALAFGIKSNSHNTHSLKAAIAHWQRDYPNHPAEPAHYTDSISEATDGSSGEFIASDVDARSIALLLPESGPYATVSKAIRQGFTAAHYAEGSHAELNFYAVNTNVDSSNILDVYQQAIDAGASIVVGPLNKLSLEALTQENYLPVSVLALNQLADNIYIDNLYQFGLSPEDEARSAADFAQSQGYYSSLILAPENEWGSRIVNAFIDQSNLSGGNAVDIAWYDTTKNDFASVIRPLMKHRSQADFVFLVARPQLARQLMPQLRFHYLKQMPVITTSHVYNGQENPRQDIDLNPIYTTDMPWIFKGVAENDPAYQQLMSLNPENLASFKRFYALGVDAYRLIPQINELSQFPSSVFNGATGQLSIDQTGHVRRKTITGQFKKGILTPLLSQPNVQY